MTTRPHDDNDHHEHAHLDGGRCLDGTGRTWKPGEPSGPFAGPARIRPTELALLLARLDRLASHLLVLTFAVVLLALCVALMLIGDLS